MAVNIDTRASQLNQFSLFYEGTTPHHAKMLNILSVVGEVKNKVTLKTKDLIKKGSRSGISIRRTKKPSTVSKLKKEADKWFSLAIRYRDGQKVVDEWFCDCITCGKRYPLKSSQAGHFQSRRWNNTRYDEENVNAQCMICNVLRHGEQYRYGIELDGKYGEGTAARLVISARKTRKFTREELEQIISDSKQIVKFYTSM